MRQNTAVTVGRKSFGQRLRADMRMNGSLYLLVLPVIAFFLIFHYWPLWGAQIAFRDFVPRRGITGSEWVGLEHFQRFLSGTYAGRVIRNTVVISVLELLFAFPAPILLALFMNELQSNKFKRTVQTVTYLPHFISLVVVTGMVKDFVSTYGIINDLRVTLGAADRIPMLARPEYFRPIYILSGIWQSIGWGSIIYLAALAGIDQELYEAAGIDGAGRWKKALNITLPSIAPTIIIMLILRVGQIMNVGYEKIILLYTQSTYETADVISSYVYRMGLLNMDLSYSAAIGLFNSAISFLLVIMTNAISRRVSETSLW